MIFHFAFDWLKSCTVYKNIHDSAFYPTPSNNLLHTLYVTAEKRWTSPKLEWAQMFQYVGQKKGFYSNIEIFL